MKNLTKNHYSLWLENPEFTRNIWQECTPQRMVAIPAILGALVLMVFLFTNASLFQSLSFMINLPPEFITQEIRCNILFYISQLGYLFLTIFWGMRLASNALTEEFNEGTWDNQRMAGLTPLQMLCGKLFGGTIIAWYAGAMLLALMAYAAFHLPSWQPRWILQIILAYLLLTITIHALYLSSMLTAWRKRNRKVGKNSRGILLFLAVWLGSSIITIAVKNLLNPGTARLFRWFSWEMEGSVLFLFLLAALLGWVLVGLWQRFRTELQLRNSPFWWLACLLFWLWVLSGFMNPSWKYILRYLGFSADTSVIHLWLAYLIASIFLVQLTLYIKLIGEPKNSMHWLRFFSFWKQKQWSRALNLFPAWGTSWLVTLGLSVIFLILLNASSVRNQNIRMMLFSLALLLFTLRDIALVLFLNLARRTQRADGAAILYLALLYSLCPWFAILSLGEQGIFLFSPLGAAPYAFYFLTPSSWVHLLSPALQALVMVGLLMKRWQQIQQEKNH